MMRVAAIVLVLCVVTVMTAGAQVTVVRQGEENAFLTIAKSTAWGGLGGLVLGGAVALIADDNQVTSSSGSLSAAFAVVWATESTTLPRETIRHRRSFESTGMESTGISRQWLSVRSSTRSLEIPERVSHCFT